jgi:hypothetical protein
MPPTQSVSLRTSTLSFGRQREHLCLGHEHLDGELHASSVQIGTAWLPSASALCPPQRFEGRACCVSLSVLK